MMRRRTRRRPDFVPARKLSFASFPGLPDALMVVSEGGLFDDR